MQMGSIPLILAAFAVIFLVLALFTLIKTFTTSTWKEKFGALGKELIMAVVVEGFLTLISDSEVVWSGLVAALS
ncbi:hypothetical protein DDA93_16010 [Arthrobacter sp. Bz4]|nr:hypothetical protein DDA93_16010 [Arthrobacter sp. Bz4]